MNVASAPAGAETINIVAFGDSGVFGSGQGKTPGGVPVAEAYPAKLERAFACERLGRGGIQPGPAYDSREVRMGSAKL